MVLFAVYLAGIRVYDDDDTRRRSRARSRRSSSTSCTSAASPKCCSTSASIALCYYAAYRLRFEDPEDFMKNFGNFTTSLPVVVGAQMVAFFASASIAACGATSA